MKNSILKLAILEKFNSQRHFLEIVTKTLPMSETRLSRLCTGHLKPYDDEVRLFCRKLRKPAAELFPNLGGKGGGK
jgi:hypothetical protein